MAIETTTATTAEKQGIRQALDIYNFYAYKSGDTDRNTTATPAADPDLIFSSIPIGVYRVEIGLQTYDNSNAGFQWEMGGTATVACLGRIRAQTLAATSTSTLTNLNISNPADSQAPWVNATRTPIYWFILNVTGAGSISIDWAQHTSDANNTRLYAGSYMTMTKIN